MSHSFATDSQPTAPMKNALNLAEHGIPIFPVGRDKKPLCQWKNSATTDPKQIATWWEQHPEAMAAIPTGEQSSIYVVDLDIDKITGEFLGEKSIAELGLSASLESAPRVRTPSGGLHFYFRHPSASFGNTASKIGPGIDTRGEGGYVVAPGSFNGNGIYEALDPIDWAALPKLPDALRQALRTARKATCLGVPSTAESAWASAAFTNELGRVMAVSEGERNDALNRAAYSLGQIVAGGGLDEIDVRNRLLAAALAVGLTEDEAHATINSGMTAGAMEPRGPKNGEPQLKRTVRDVDLDGSDGRPPEYSDDVVALRFADLHKDDLRFVATWSRWLTWSDYRWLSDKTLAAFDMIRSVCREATSTCTNPKLKLSLASAKTVVAVERLAKSDRLLAGSIEQWDANPDIINTPWSNS
jgi:putative DNA primase/helicase